MQTGSETQIPRLIMCRKCGTECYIKEETNWTIYYDDPLCEVEIENCVECKSPLWWSTQDRKKRMNITLETFKKLNDE